jgi:hypothetical protein
MAIKATLVIVAVMAVIVGMMFCAAYLIAHGATP